MTIDSNDTKGHPQEPAWYKYRLPRHNFHKEVQRIAVDVHNAAILSNGFPFPLYTPRLTRVDKIVRTYSSLKEKLRCAIMLRADCAEIGFDRAKDEITAQKNVWEAFQKGIDYEGAFDQAPTPKTPYSRTGELFVRSRAALSGFFKPSMDYYPKG